MNTLLLVLLLGQQSLFSDDEVKVAKPIIVPKVSKELAQPITLQVYPVDKPMSAASTEDPKTCTGMVKVGDKYFGTGIAISVEGYKYVITCNHVIKDIKPDDSLMFKGNVIHIVYKDARNDLCVLGGYAGPCINISPIALHTKDVMTSVGSDGNLPFNITTDTHTIGEILDTMIFATGPYVQGRSGCGLFDTNNNLVGIYCGVHAINKLQVYTPMSPLIADLDKIKQFRIKLYSGKHCKYCQQQHRITDTPNDKRIIFEWSEDLCPDWILKKLEAGYNFPIAVWECEDGTFGWPTKSRVYTIDEFYSMCESMHAQPTKDHLTMSSGLEKPCGALAIGAHIDNLFNWYNTYLAHGARATMDWSRSGQQAFNVYGGKKAPLNLENLMGKTGSFAFNVDYPNGVLDSDKLQVRELKFGYTLIGDDIKFDIDDLVVHGIIKVVDSQLVFKSDIEQPKGFIGIMTLWSIVSTARTIWVLVHPVADICIGGQLKLCTYLDNGTIYIDFLVPPTVKILSLMTFNLAIHQIIITHEHLVAKFSGTMFAKQYTMDVVK